MTNFARRSDSSQSSHIGVVPRKAYAASGTRRRLLLGTVALGGPQLADANAGASPQIVFMDVGVCPEMQRSDRAIGDKSVLCSDPDSIGRLVMRLDRDAAPQTAANFVQLIQEGAYNGTTFHKVIPGRYIKAGKQGSRRYGAVDTNRVSVPPNSDTVSSRAFSTQHLRPGTVSWCVGENDDDGFVKERRGYENAQFMITTGPGPAFDLDGANIAFGQVTEGMDVIRYIASIPTIKANDTMERYNAVASFLGDDRAAKARAKWNTPLRAVIITNSGLL